MKTLEEIKIQVCHEMGYSSLPIMGSREFWHDVARRYAEQAIERCAEVAKLDRDYLPNRDALTHYVDRQSILNVKTELK